MSQLAGQNRQTALQSASWPRKPYLRRNRSIAHCPDVNGIANSFSLSQLSKSGHWQEPQASECHGCQLLSVTAIVDMKVRPNYHSNRRCHSFHGQVRCHLKSNDPKPGGCGKHTHTHKHVSKYFAWVHFGVGRRVPQTKTLTLLHQDLDQFLV